MTNKATATEDRSIHEHVRSLRKVKLTFNEDQIWVLYRLLVRERSAGAPTLLPGLSREHDHTMGMALSQLSNTYIDLTTPKEGDI